MLRLLWVAASDWFLLFLLFISQSQCSVVWDICIVIPHFCSVFAKDYIALSQSNSRNHHPFNICYSVFWDSSCEEFMSPSPEPLSPSYQKKTRIPKLKMHEPLCNQTVNLETDAKTLYYSLLKLKYSPSICLKHKILK